MIYMITNSIKVKDQTGNKSSAKIDIKPEEMIDKKNLNTKATEEAKKNV
jgi:hypothetical protein